MRHSTTDATAPTWTRGSGSRQAMPYGTSCNGIAENIRGFSSAATEVQSGYETWTSGRACSWSIAPHSCVCDLHRHRCRGLRHHFGIHRAERHRQFLFQFCGASKVLSTPIPHVEAQCRVFACDLNDWLAFSASVSKLEVYIWRSQRKVRDQHVTPVDFVHDRLRDLIITVNKVHATHLEWQTCLVGCTHGGRVVVAESRFLFLAKGHRDEDATRSPGV